MINVVIVGFGFMGMIHAGNILKNPNARLTAIVDKNKDNIQQKLKEQSGNFTVETISAAKLSGINIYDDLGSCLLKEKPDVCILAVHTSLHLEMAKMAIESGAHVFVEKPFCLDVQQGQSLIELAAERKKTLMVGHVVRFMPAWQRLKKIIDTGEYGVLEFLSLSRFSGIPSWGQWKDKLSQFGSTGGALFDLVVHDIDFAQWVCGIPDEINAYCLPGKLSNYDYVSALWKYNNKNFHVKIEGGNAFHGNFPFSASFTARLQDASLTYSSMAPDNITVATGSDVHAIPVGDGNLGFSGELDYFMECILNKRPPVLCLPDSSLETINICYRHLQEVKPA